MYACTQELYGPTTAGRLLNSFSRMFTAYMQWHGFTCGFDDLLLNPSAEAQRAVSAYVLLCMYVCLCQCVCVCFTCGFDDLLLNPSAKAQHAVSACVLLHLCVYVFVRVC